jgi:hypothetical protein
MVRRVPCAVRLRSSILCALSVSKIAGVAGHIGARVAASAEPGEVRVTSTVRDLVAGSEL